MGTKQQTKLVQQFDELVFELIHRISRLGTVSRDRLLEKAHHIHLEPGQRLAAKDWPWSLLYLVEGTLTRETPERPDEVLQTGRMEVDQPLFSNSASRQSRVTAAKASEVLAFDRRLFELLEEEEEEEKVDICDMDEAESELFRRFTLAHHLKRLEIPGVPEVAERIRKLVDVRNLDLPQLSHLVALDPALAARVIRAVDGQFKEDGISAAVALLGREQVREIILEYGLETGCVEHSPLVREQMLKAHRHSVHVSMYAYVLAKELEGLNPNHALLCGLLHDVGMFPLLCASEQYGDRFATEDALNAMVWKLHGMIGGLVLGSWGFDNHLVSLAEEADNWYRDTAERVPDYTDVVLVAQLHSFIGTERARKLPKFSEVPAFRKIAGKRSGPSFSLHVLQQASPRILAVERSLEGIL